MTWADVVARLPELRAVAEKATPGPWQHDAHYPMFIGERHAVIRPAGDAVILGIAGVLAYTPETKERRYDTRAANDATYIATFDPPTVLSLLAIIEEDGKRIAAMENELDDGDDLTAELETEAAKNARLREQVGRLGDGLEKIAVWFDQFPPSGQTWPDGTPMSYGAAFGSNGERDFMRKLAGDTLDEAAALATAPDKQKDKADGE